MRIPKKRRFALAKPIVSASKQQALKSAIRRRVVLERIRVQNERERARHAEEREANGEGSCAGDEPTDKKGKGAGQGAAEEKDPEPVTEEDLATLEGELKALNQKKVRLFLLLKQVMNEERKRKRVEEELRTRKAEEKAYLEEAEVEQQPRLQPYQGGIMLSPLRSGGGGGRRRESWGGDGGRGNESGGRLHGRTGDGNLMRDRGEWERDRGEGVRDSRGGNGYAPPPRERMDRGSYRRPARPSMFGGYRR